MIQRGRILEATRLTMVLAGLIVSTVPADAQVTMDNSALDALRSPTPQAAPRPATRRTPVHKPAAVPAATPIAPQTPPATSPQKPASAPVVAAKPAKPAIPVAPPAIAALPPPVVVPLAHPPPPPIVPVADDAPGDAKPVTGGVRITFGTDRADLNPATVAVLRDFARSEADQPRPINIFAYATGRPEDPSTPRRLSLERALAARAVLMREGIPSPRIYPRALGPTGGSTDPDRVDVTTAPADPPVIGGAG